MKDFTEEEFEALEDTAIELSRKISQFIVETCLAAVKDVESVDERKMILDLLYGMLSSAHSGERNQLHEAVEGMISMQYEEIIPGIRLTAAGSKMSDAEKDVLKEMLLRARTEAFEAMDAMILGK